jgi:type II secretory pathway component PulC
MTGSTCFPAARIVPLHRAEAIDGFQLMSIQPGSLFARLDIRSGDRLLRIDDRTLASPEDAIDLVHRFYDRAVESVELERNGTVLRKELVVIE